MSIDEKRPDLSSPVPRYTEAASPTGFGSVLFTIARGALTVEEWLHELRKKLGVKEADASRWIDYILNDEELREGLATPEGSWQLGAAFTAAESEVSSTANTLVSEIMKKLFVDGESKKAIRLNLDVEQEGKADWLRPKAVERGYPLFVRVVRNGVDGRPTSFIDLRCDNSMSFDNVDWNALVDGNAAQGLQASEERYVDQWFFEGDRPDGASAFAAPDIVVGRSTSLFNLPEEIRVDKRVMTVLNITELDSVSVGAVSVCLPTHLPFDGMEVMQAIAGSVDSMVSRGLLQATDKEHAKDLLEKSGLFRARVIPLSSFFSSQLDDLDDGSSERAIVARQLERDFLGDLVMRQFAELFDVWHAEIEGEIPEELLSEIITLSKEMRSRFGMKIRVSLLLALANFLVDWSAPGLPLPPSEGGGRLAIAPIGSGVLKQFYQIRDVLADNSIELDEFLAELMMWEGLYGEVRGLASSALAVEAIKNYKWKDDWLVVESEKRGSYYLMSDAIVRGYIKEDVSMMSRVLEVLSKPVAYEYDEVIIGDAEKNDGVREPHRIGGLLLQIDLMMYDLYREVTSEQFIKTDLLSQKLKIKALLNNLEELKNPQFCFPLTDADFRIAMQNAELVSGVAGTVWEEDRDKMLQKIYALRRELMRQAIAAYQERGVAHQVKRQRDLFQKKDAANFNQYMTAVTTQLNKVGVGMSGIETNARTAPSAVQARLGPLAALESWGTNTGAGEVTASARPQDQISNMVVPKNIKDYLQMFFHTALARRTNVGVGIVDNQLAMKESVMQPNLILPLVLTALRASQTGEILLQYAEQHHGDDGLVEVVRKMIRSDEYLSLIDTDGEAGGQAVMYGKIWSRQHEDRLVAAATNAARRKELENEARVFLQVFTDFIQDVMRDQNADLNLKNTVAKFVEVGLEHIWKSMMEYKLASYNLELANLTFIFRSWLNPGQNHTRIRAMQSALGLKMEEAYQALIAVSQSAMRMNED